MPAFGTASFYYHEAKVGKLLCCFKRETITRPTAVFGSNNIPVKANHCRQQNKYHTSLGG
ncbi:hypothetical protein Bcoa_0797 [Heyndrickxia coagulans 36D1]|uniref:Uncharacterized protein n=1 Tax=Heyndrickxia coagulans 36D1 TaxID=345219 RepID=G2THB5_HEYCO|nr:hypothetical protein Bcoa_0797 [Heyndrickxia coagulans 36D1]